MMNAPATRTPSSDEAAWRACADWYHALFTGSLLAAVTHCGAADAAELVYRIFCRQREQRFLPGLVKLGIDKLPPAVACAQYHYLSNDIGGVPVEYIHESDRKAWVRYPVPRWVWAGTALCAIPSEVSKAMLRGWHAQNGVSLNNPRIGFVYTKQAADGDASLEGYYYEYDEPLAPEQRLRHAPQEDGPPFDPAKAPKLSSAQWPRERQAKAYRNYAMEYLRTLLPVAVGQFGPDRAVQVFQMAARKVALQFYHQSAAALGIATGAARSGDSFDEFAAFVTAMGAAQGDAVSVRRVDDAMQIEQPQLALFRDRRGLHPAVLHCWNGLIEGALAACDSRLRLQTSFGYDPEQPAFGWRVERRV